jgi:hypothetical protein
MMPPHHEAYCNANPSLEVGCDGCSCRAGREIKRLRRLLSNTDPVAWEVWWGIGEMTRSDQVFRNRVDALTHAAQIKSGTDVRPLYDTPAVSPDDIASPPPAENRMNDEPRLALWCAQHPDDAAAEIERLRAIISSQHWTEPSLLQQRVDALFAAHDASTDHKTRDALRAAMSALEQRRD